MVLADSHGISRVPRYSGTCPASQHAFVYRAVTVSGRSFQIVRLACWFVTRRPCGLDRPYNPSVHARLVWALPRSLAATSGITICFLFLQVLRWFTSLRCLPPAYGFSRGSSGINREGLPHSDISGSKPVCGSPKLFAAYHVLHRLLAPRHPPYALSSLTIRNLELYAALAQRFGARGLPSAEPKHCRVSSHAHCVCVVGKLPFAEYSVVKERQPAAKARPSRRRDRRARTADSLRSACNTSAPAPQLRAQVSPSSIQPERLVENTGLEPVTSWLQTRRSPS